LQYNDIRPKIFIPVLRDLGVDTTKRAIRCLNPSHEDKKPSLYLNYSVGRGQCKSGNCEWWGDGIDLIQLVKNVSKDEAHAIVKQICGLTDDFDKMRGNINQIKSKEIYTQIIYESIMKKAKCPEAAGHLSTYLGIPLERSKELCEQENIGYLDIDAGKLYEQLKDDLTKDRDESFQNKVFSNFFQCGVLDEKFNLRKEFYGFCKKRLIFPLREGCLITTLSARAMDDSLLKFLVLSSRDENDKSRMTNVWGIDDVDYNKKNIPIVLVEGEGDRLAILGNDLPVVPICFKGTGNLSTPSFKEKILKLIEQKFAVVILADKDDAGMRTAEQAGISIPGLRITYNPSRYGKDMRDWSISKNGDIDKAEFMEIIHVAERITSISADAPLSSIPLPKGYQLSGDYLEVYKLEKPTDDTSGRYVLLSKQMTWIEKITRSSRHNIAALIGYVDPFGKRRYQCIPAEDYSDVQKLRKYAAFGLPIRPGNATAMVEYYMSYAAEYANHLPALDVCERMGWQGTPDKPWPYILGKMSYGHNIQMTNSFNEQMISLSRGLHVSGDFDLWRDAARDLWNASDTARFLMSVAFSGPLLHPFGCDTWLVYLWGGKMRTSTSGKTTVSMMCLSSWGNPRDLFQSFGSTEVGIIESASMLSDIFYVLDEKQTARSEDMIRRAIYQLAMGKASAKGLPGGGVREQKTWRLTGIANGEQPIVKQWDGEDARVFQVRASDLFVDIPTGLTPRTFANYLKKVYTKNYGHAGQKYIQVVMELVQDKAQREEMDELIENYQEQFSGLAKEDSMLSRMGHQFAVATVAGELLCKHILELPSSSVFDSMKTIYNSEVGAMIDSNDIASRALEITAEFILQYRSRFNYVLREGEQRYGLIYDPACGGDDTYYYKHPEDKKKILIAPSILNDHFTKCKIDHLVVRQVWKDRGWLECDLKNSTLVRCIQGNTARMLVLDKKVLDNLEAKEE